MSNSKKMHRRQKVRRTLRHPATRFAVFAFVVLVLVALHEINVRNVAGAAFGMQAFELFASAIAEKML